jgi:hypothetical protein
MNQTTPKQKFLTLTLTALALAGSGSAWAQPVDVASLTMKITSVEEVSDGSVIMANGVTPEGRRVRISYGSMSREIAPSAELSLRHGLYIRFEDLEKEQSASNYYYAGYDVFFESRLNGAAIYTGEGFNYNRSLFRPNCKEAHKEAAVEALNKCLRKHRECALLPSSDWVESDNLDFNFFVFRTYGFRIMDTDRGHCITFAAAAKKSFVDRLTP